MDIDLDPKIKVHLGLWTNWSRGSVLGATITLKRFDANILIAFTSVFLGFVGSRFWRVLCLLLHRYYSRISHSNQDGLYHQQQIILRNSQTAESGFLSLIRLYLAWRGSSERPLWRILPSTLSAGLTFVAFIIAGGFSATISTSAGRDVLVDSTHCGVLQPMSDSDLSINRATKIASNDANYAQQCYSPDTLGVFDCTTYVKPRLPFTIDYDAACPFKQGICKNETHNIYIDSGYISSQVHLGLNAPEADAIHYRTTLHCAPLTTEGYRTTKKEGSREFTRYHYGNLKVGANGNYSTANYTFRIDSLKDQYPSGPNFFGKNFMLDYVQAKTWNGTFSDASDFDPIPELSRNDGDVMIIFLSGNGVQFIQPTTDPWYHATTQGSTAKLTGTTDTWDVYNPDEAASPLGCVSQYQFCQGGPPSHDKQSSNCGPLSGYLDSKLGAASAFDYEVNWSATGGDSLPKDISKTASRFQWFIRVWNVTPDPEFLMNTLRASTLASQRNFQGGIQGPLPDNQWQIDMTRLWNISLASLQSMLVSVAQGELQPEMQPYIDRPLNHYQHEMCANQKVLSSQFGSFSVFALCFTYIVGFLLVVLSFAIEAVLDLRLRRRQRKFSEDNSEGINKPSLKHIEWITNGTLQQHRLAQEGLGWGGGTWKKCTYYVPITSKGEVLGSLDIHNPDHPLLCLPGSDNLGHDVKEPLVTETEQHVEEVEQNKHPQTPQSPPVEASSLSEGFDSVSLPDSYATEDEEISMDNGNARYRHPA